MPLNIPATYYESAFEMQQNVTLKPAIVTMGWKYDGANFDGDRVTVEESFVTNILPRLSDSITLVRVTWRDASGTLRDTGYSAAGGNSDPGTSPNVAYLVKKNTGVGGRKNRGRMYVPGCVETKVDSAGIVTPTFQATLQGNFTDWQEAAAVANFTMQILHNSVVDPTVVTSLFVESTVATQRRRLR
jgi:hypothetical protein